MATIIEMVEELQVQMAAAQTTLASLQTNVASITNTIAPYPSRFASIESRVTANETCCSGNSSRITTLEGNVGTLSAGLNSVQSTIATVQSSVGTLADTMSNYPARFTAIENNVSDLDTAINAATTGIEDVEDDIKGIQTVITGLQSATSGLQTSIATLTDGQNTANGRITGVENSATALAGQYTEQQLEINALKAQDVTTIANVAANTAAIANVQGKIADSGWKDLVLEPGIQVITGSQRPQYRKIGSRVYLRGAFKGVAGSMTKIGNLPTGYRPSMRLIGSGIRMNFETARIEVELNGDIMYLGSSTSAKAYDVNNWHSLESINFSVD